MRKFSLEIENWGTWSLEKDFSSLDRAIRHGREKFPQNEWRVFDRVSGEFVYFNDPLMEMQQEANQELLRYEETTHWRQVLGERHQQSIVENQRQQNEYRREEQRRQRLRGFGFVGGQPAQRIPAPRPRSFQLFDYQQLNHEWNWDEEESFFQNLSERIGRKRKRTVDKVNWKKEGF